MDLHGNVDENIVDHNGCLIPKDLYYDIENQVWIRLEPDGNVTYGLTDVGQTRSGKLLHIRIKDVGKKIPKGKPVASLESGKWAGPIPCIVEGEVVRRNEELLEQADIINYDPYGRGWIVTLKPVNLERDLKDLVTGEEAIRKMKEYIDREDIICMRCT
ncbi:glycine cleavage system protein H [Hydrogenobaculum sp.]|jgi:glycine cleavage system H protein|nr:glycine cleavage H-protein [Hydrogenobaculum sp. Y04AAS1]PMP62279.1 MAG: glycine cleavage system protein H [Hydrogenobaculum sp.]PMP90601.1 MAG: glycine cleavage system protein H [Hydrogenobaculum sp.]HCT66326.1 glycine cleavage system protein H [Hydrogenobaculum sp.]HEK25451.1 glycine cleavage system protein H [Hydrogenobaculum sp.]